jgi:hypothetical protein
MVRGKGKCFKENNSAATCLTDSLENKDGSLETRTGPLLEPSPVTFQIHSTFLFQDGDHVFPAEEEKAKIQRNVRPPDYIGLQWWKERQVSMDCPASLVSSWPTQDKN